MLWIVLVACSGSGDPVAPVDPVALEPVAAPVPGPEVAPAPVDPPAPALPDGMVLVDEVAPPLISRERVMRVQSHTLEDGTTVRVAVGEPIEATAHYAYDHPEGFSPGRYKMAFGGDAMGDYYHLTFNTDDGQIDFGSGSNDLSGLGGDRELQVGKTFWVDWDYRPAVFVCCEGQYDQFVGMKPYITSITPVE